MIVKVAYSRASGQKGKGRETQPLCFGHKALAWHCISPEVMCYFMQFVCPQGSTSPTPQFKGINSLTLSFLHSPTLTSIHDYWKNHSLDSTDLCWQSNVSAFQYAVYVGHSFSSKKQTSFNFMGAVTICSDFGAQENKVCHRFHCFPIYLP